MPTKRNILGKIVTYLVIKCDQRGISCGHWKADLFHFGAHLWCAATGCCQQHLYFSSLNALGVVVVGGCLSSTCDRAAIETEEEKKIGKRRKPAILRFTFHIKLGSLSSNARAEMNP